MLELSREHFREWIPFQRAEESTGEAFDRALRLGQNGDQSRSAWRRVGVTPSGRIIGGCAIYAMVRGLSMEASMHWWVGADSTGLGYGQEIVNAAIQYATADLPEGLGLHKIYASIHPTNLASVALAERTGFTRIGRSRHPVQVGDRWERLDEYEYTAPIGEAYQPPEGGVCELVPVLSIPGRASIVPSRATRS